MYLKIVEQPSKERHIIYMPATHFVDDSGKIMRMEKVVFSFIQHINKSIGSLLVKRLVKKLYFLCIKLYIIHNYNFIVHVKQIINPFFLFLFAAQLLLN